MVVAVETESDMMLLVGKSPKTLLKYNHLRNIGRLVQPRDMGRVAATPRLGFLWAADNDAYSNFNEDRYVRMLDKCQGVPGCLFVTCPDVVADADATFNLYLKWSRDILGRRLPLGYVIQDGLTVDSVIPWNGITAIFVGGTTEWKLGTDAHNIITEAKRRGLWVHMGRVNSARRIRYAQSIGCDSVDGSSLSKFTDTRLPGLAEKADAPVQGML